MITRNVLLSGSKYVLISSSRDRMDVRLPHFLTHNGDVSTVFEDIMDGLTGDDVATISAWVLPDRVSIVVRGEQVDEIEC
jgi:hypothetical protein